MKDNLTKLTIKQASRRLGVPRHTLRFWEKELDGLIVPLRTEGGQRRYTSGNLLVFEEIKRLKKMGFRLSEIRHELQSRFGRLGNQEGSGNMDVLADRIAELVRQAVYSFLQEREIET